MFENQEYPHGQAICSDYLIDQTAHSSADFTFSILIAVINQICQIVVEHIVYQMHYGTKSGQSNAMMIINFVLTFVNTVVMVILLNANFSESEIPFLKDNLTAG